MDDKIIEKLIELDEKVSATVTMVEFGDFKNSFASGQDKMIKILDRLDTERMFTEQWIKRMEEDFETQKHQIQEHEDSLQKIKLQLQIA
ncbi:MAG: hypothetical protein WCT40_03805 [Candidatus Magasanikbacteria bacterium]